MKIDALSPTDAILEELGRRLAATRKQQGLSQHELASAAGVGVATLRRIEAGNDSQLGSWLKLLRALGSVDAVDVLLPRDLRSPMAEAKAARSKGQSTVRETSANFWGDEAP